MNRRSGRGLWLPCAYLGLVALAALYLAYRLVFAVENSEFAGLPLLLLALPWSDWLAPVAGNSSMAGWTGLLVGVVANALALFLIGRLMAMAPQAGAPAARR